MPPSLVDPPDGSRGLSPAAARVLARELREAVFQHQAKVRGQQGVGRVCPFDLQALIPIPAEILERGPDHPISITWLHPLGHDTRAPPGADHPPKTWRDPAECRGAEPGVLVGRLDAVDGDRGAAP